MFVLTPTTLPGYRASTAFAMSATSGSLEVKQVLAAAIESLPLATRRASAAPPIPTGPIGGGSLYLFTRPFSDRNRNACGGELALNIPLGRALSIVEPLAAAPDPVP
jgi:hypothetical protein